ncbi:MAG: alpha/beta hydrolase [Proteobacteria bacterium]|nr:alpha/beta hydrolase [Pseudomonadota bacterium]
MRALPAALGIMLFALAALLLAGQSLRTLESASQGLEVTRGHVDAIPVTVFRPAGAAVADGRDRARPVVVIAHGFAGSQQLMQAFATTAARNGMIAVTFDFPGHGRHPQPLPGSLQQHEALLAALLGAVDRVVGFARTLPGADGRVALLGHSMASDLVVRQAQADPSIVATVGVSLVYGGARMVAPNNLLSIYGSIEPAMVQSFGRRLVAGPDATDEAARSVVPGQTYGRFEDGSARRFVLANGAEHIGVLYHATSQHEALAWLRRAFDGVARAPSTAPAAAFIDARGPAIAGLLAGTLALAWPLSTLLGWRAAGSVRGQPVPAALGLPLRTLARRDWLWLAVGPALATPLLLRVVPSHFLPILLGDYLLLHFGLYGLLTALGSAWLARSGRLAPLPAGVPSPATAAVALTMIAWATLAMGIPVDRYVFNLWPADGRGPLILAMLVGTLVWAMADEGLARHPQAPRFAYPATKALFLGSLVLAVALDLSRLFFLVIIIPAILLMFIAYGLLSRWCFRATGSPWTGALASALAFAWGIAVTFPAINR